MILKIILLLFIYSCGPSEGDDCHKEVIFENNSEESIYLIWTETLVIGNECDNFIRGEIQSMSEFDILGSNNSCVENIINNSLNGAIVVYLFEENPNITECDSVAGHPDIIERLEFTVADLNALDWTVEYP